MKTIQVKVKPNARTSSLEEAGDGLWLARVKSPPVDGKANAELVAKKFACLKSAVSISSAPDALSLARARELLKSAQFDLQALDDASGRMKLVRIKI